MVQDLSIQIQRVKIVAKHLEIVVHTLNGINIHDMLASEYGGKSYYFKPIENADQY